MFEIVSPLVVSFNRISKTRFPSCLIPLLFNDLIQDHIGTTGMRTFILFFFGLLLSASPASAQKMLVFMDLEQQDHLKAYGIAFEALEQGYTVEWLLNYRGGSFVMDPTTDRVRACYLRGVSFKVIDGAELVRIYAHIEENNMDRMLLE